MFNCRFYNKAEACDSTDSTARRDNEVRLFFWIGITPANRTNYQPVNKNKKAV